LTQLPTFLVGRDLEAGTLVAVLPGQAGEGPPVHAIYPQARHLSPKVRVAVDRLAATFSPVPPWDASMHLVAS
jgi:DNA-binding transcriptional LysR family regulator